MRHSSADRVKSRCQGAEAKPTDSCRLFRQNVPKLYIALPKPLLG